MTQRNFISNFLNYLVILIVTVIFIVMIEILAGIYIYLTSPEQAKVIFTSHPVVGEKNQNIQIDHRGMAKQLDPIPFHPLYGWRYDGPAKFWGLNVGVNGFITNSENIDDVLDSTAKIKIFIIGGSTVAGSGSSTNENTISANLERLLKKRNLHEISVINAGTGGWYSANEVAFLTQEVITFYNPDLVIIMDGYNDSMRAASSASLKYKNIKEKSLLTHHLIDPALQEQKKNWIAIQRSESTALFRQWIYSLGIQKLFIWKLLNDKSSNINYFFKQKPDIQQKEEKVTIKNDVRKCLDIDLDLLPYEMAIRIAAGTAITTHTKLIYILQPSIVFKEKLHPNEIKPLKENIDLTFEGKWKDYGLPAGTCFLDFQKKFFSQAANMIRRIETELPLKYVQFKDYSELFMNTQEDVFYDYAHYTDYGNELIARKLLRDVLSILKE